jgi:hypothetical protein
MRQVVYVPIVARYLNDGHCVVVVDVMVFVAALGLIA